MRGYCLFIGAFGSVITVPAVILYWKIGGSLDGSLAPLDTLAVMAFVTVPLFLYGMFGRDDRD